MFRGKRQFHDIVNRIDIIGGDTHFLHFLPVKRRVVINVIHNFLESYALFDGENMFLEQYVEGESQYS